MYKKSFFLLLLIILLFTSCSKEKESPVEQNILNDEQKTQEKQPPDDTDYTAEDTDYDVTVSYLGKIKVIGEMPEKVNFTTIGYNNFCHVGFLYQSYEDKYSDIVLSDEERDSFGDYVAFMNYDEMGIVSTIGIINAKIVDVIEKFPAYVRPPMPKTMLLEEPVIAFVFAGENCNTDTGYDGIPAKLLAYSRYPAFEDIKTIDMHYTKDELSAFVGFLFKNGDDYFLQQSCGLQVVKIVNELPDELIDIVIDKPSMDSIIPLEISSDNLVFIYAISKFGEEDKDKNIIIKAYGFFEK